jgi:hypothetical protein
MDRCYLCKGQLNFYGISIKPVWTKWLECSVCATYSACNEFGALVLHTKRIPDTAYFAKYVDRPNKREDSKHA